MENKKANRIGSSKRRLEIPEGVSGKRRKLDSNCSMTIRSTVSTSTRISISSSISANFSASIRMTSDGNVTVRDRSGVNIQTSDNRTNLSRKGASTQGKGKFKSDYTKKYSSSAGSTTININLEASSQKLIEIKPQVKSSPKCTPREKKSTSTNNNVSSAVINNKRSNKASKLSAATVTETEPRRSKNVGDVKYKHKGSTVERSKPKTVKNATTDTNRPTKSRSNEVKSSAKVETIGSNQGEPSATIQIKSESEKPATSEENKHSPSRRYKTASKERTKLVLKKSELMKRTMPKAEFNRLEKAVQEWNRVFKTKHTLHKKLISL